MRSTTTSTPSLPVPDTQAAWKWQRTQIRTVLETLLGELPPPIVPEVEILSRGRRQGILCEHFRFYNGDPLGGPGSTVTGYLLLPEGLKAPAPAIQYLHWHAGQYDLGKEQLWRTASRGLSPAEELTSRGYIVLAIDAYGFGERSGTGPDGPEQRGSAEEMSLSKLNLWYGRTLWGMMLRDERLALDLLCARPEVDVERIGVIGMSMGSTRAWWHMALDERLRAGVGVACLTRYQELLMYHALAEHGIYFFVPGMLRRFDIEAVVALCAPRALLCLNGALDKGSPVKGIRAVESAVEPVYTLLGAQDRFRSILYTGVGHEWTPAMWQETLVWLHRHVTGIPTG